MARMGDIEREAAEAVAHWFHHRNDHHDQETPMSTPAQQPTFLGHVASVLSDLDSNQLISELIGHGLGKLLQPGEIQTVISFVAGLEAVRQPQRAVQPVTPGEQAGA